MPTKSQLRDVALHAAQISRRIDEGRLPVVLADRVSAGYGSGSKCNGCDQPITHTQIEYDVQDSGTCTARLNLHLRCYVLWQTECVRRMEKRNHRDSPLLGHL